MKNNFYIYFHFKKNTDIPFYIGKGRGRRAYVKYGRTDFWDKIVSKYGYDIELIEENLTEQEAFISEIYWIAQLKNWGYKLCNLTDGGEGPTGWKPSDETKKKISDSLKGEKSPNYGKTLSAETRKKVGDAQRGEKNHMFGEKHSEETKQKMSEAHKGKKFSDEHKQKISESNKGKKMSDEAKKKISESKKGKKLSKASCLRMGESRRGKKRGSYKKKN